MFIAVIGYIFVMATLFSIERKLAKSNELHEEMIALLKEKKKKE
ncbi:hypothetical protein P4U90_07975 [Cytobacillus kochii]|nr:hypothetical protein [Cytobacillus kochii]